MIGWKISWLVTVLIVLIVITGCHANIDVNKIKNEVECRELTGTYIWIAGRCCLDSNQNGVCDDDEGSRSCSDACSQPGCMEDNQFKAYDCVKGKDGCLHRKVLSIQVGRCNVECLNADACRLGQKCVNYKCEDKICGDRQCDDTENCNCIDCSVPEGSICCLGIAYQGDCCIDNDCLVEEICENYVCTPVPKCGDGICHLEAGEDCQSCVSDCRIPEGSICCSAVVVEGNCCTSEDCVEHETCINNDCIAVEQKPVNVSAN